MATGSGKTPCAIEIMHQMPGPALCLAHRGELLDRARDKMAAFGIVPDLEKAEARASMDSPVVLASVQSLQNSRLERYLADHFKFIWIDEVHHAPAISYRNILEHFTAAKVFDCTATLDRLDGEGFEDLFEKISYEKSLASLLKEGWLSRILARLKAAAY
jgi:superfamily II DNA or RNA helicase